MPSLKRAIEWEINTCNADNVGYSQNYRNQKTVNGVTYYDCSSFQWYGLLAGGFDVTTAYQQATGEAYSGNAIRTINMRPWLTALGFIEAPITGEWRQGDILWRGSSSSGSWRGHTEMVYSGGTGRGRTMGAHSSGRPLDQQVSITSYESSASDWMSLWRYSGSDTGTAYSLYVISAILGNWYVESTINPGLWETPSHGSGSFTDLNRGFGLGQWTNTNGDTHGRLWQMYQWLSENGYSADDGYGQLMYFLHENTWYSAGTEAGQYATLTDFLNSTSTDLNHLTSAFMRGWEGIDGNITLRIQRANEVFSYLQAHGNNTTVTTWISENRYLSPSEVMNNAILAYRFLGSGGGGGGTGSRRKMPLWMMLRPWYTY